MILRESRRRRCQHQRDEETNEATTACDHDSDYIDKRILLPESPFLTTRWAAVTSTSSARRAPHLGANEPRSSRPYAPGAFLPGIDSGAATLLGRSWLRDSAAL